MSEHFRNQIDEALGGPVPDVAVQYVGRPHLASVFDVSGLVRASVTAAAVELAAVTGATATTVDAGLADHWFDMTIRPIGWDLPPSWDSIAGIYQTRDGWIRLHTNVPAHREAALRVLQVDGTRAAVAAAVARWPGLALQDAIDEAGGVAGVLQDTAQWAAHPQGRAVAAEPLIHWSGPVGATLDLPDLRGDLSGLRVLDLTRVLAGPVATRFLAGFGASVLRIDPPDWQDHGLPPETTLGKACAGLNLHDPEDRARFETLLSEAHVLVHGYRPGALDGLGYGPARRRALNPGMVELCLSAYGWTGPWAARRGFDSIVQMTTGIAHAGMAATGADGPVPLPVQALDHATGYLMAAAALRGLRNARDGTGPRTARLSLARTAHLLMSGGRAEGSIATDAPEPRLEDGIEQTAWGPARRVAFPVMLEGRRARWTRPAGPLRSAQPYWPDRG